MVENVTVHHLIGCVGQVDDPAALLDSLRARGKGEVLCLNADMVCGREHIASAVDHADRAFRYGTNSSDVLAMEIMLYASGEKQLAKARERMGPKKGTERLALVCLVKPLTDEDLGSLGLKRDDSVLEFSIGKAKAMGVSEEEIASMPEHLAPDLVLERVAFVETLKR
ncbi:MAG: Kinase binding protein CGI-121 [Methanomassiliicoccales archaeon PtaU1.Bin124]|nr:MAG: Kinase binding protein CGI-121 [Methanomassiliicoccales archaeon PtaU1.Bin124]